ncbi:MAG: hypothetical protein VB104_07890 [Candidatus Limiplasma sp.]|nr:hypothetical protein [Candidatus Limiplasma sp.]
MPYYVVKNYRDTGGNRDVIGGELRIRAGATLTVEPGATLDGLPQAHYMEEIGAGVTTVAALRAEVNQLLAMLKAAGLMAATAPTIAATTQPADLELVAGAIDSGDVLTAAFTVSDGGTPTLQWYSNASDSNAGGTLIAGATAAGYAIPTDTAAGTYYFYCVATYEGVTQASDAATVVVAAA